MKNRNKKGFTLVELVIVIAVIAILAGVLIGTFATVLSSANKSKALQEWKAAIDEAYVKFMADYHVVPSFVSVDTTNKVVKFYEEAPASGYYKYESANTTTAKYIELNHDYSVYLVIGTDKSYSVASLSGVIAASTDA